MELKKRFYKMVLVVAVLAGFLTAAAAEAASVYNCSASGRKCIIKLEEGIIGDKIKVLDEKARLIAQGRIMRRKGAYAVVKIKKAAKTIRKGYPVIIDIENRASNLQWAAAFSNRD